MDDEFGERGEQRVFRAGQVALDVVGDEFDERGEKGVSRAG